MIGSDVGKARRSQCRRYFFNRVTLHPVDDLFVLPARFIHAVGFVADHERAARFQYSAHLGKAMLKSRPEIDRFKCGCKVKRTLLERKLGDVAANHGASARRDHILIEFLRLIDRDRRIIERGDLRLRITFQKLLCVPSAAAAELGDIGGSDPVKMRHPPVGELRVPAVHSVYHHFTEKALRLSCLIDEFFEESHSQIPFFL